eukprot:m.55638 g.55638  ORF g.55638 m.55638 type:complete len:558 (+) comp22113_c1_seq3:236-1909(+)
MSPIFRQLGSIVFALLLPCVQVQGLCGGSTLQQGLHWPQDVASIMSLKTPNATACADACCRTPTCGHWVWTSSEPTKTPSCDVGMACCWLKAGQARLPTASNSNDTIGVLQPPPPVHSATITINTVKPVAKLADPRFISVGCEMWEWLFDPEALNNPVLRSVAKAFAPAVLRVGGLSADQTQYTTDPIPPNSPWPPVAAGTNLLNTTTFDALVEFCRDTGLSLMFNLNEMWLRDGPNASTKELNLTGSDLLLRHMRDTHAIYPDGPIFAVELGNELTPNVLPVSTQAADYVKVRALLNQVFSNAPQRPKLYGPSTDNCEGMDKFLDGVGKGTLDVFTYHSYPLGGGGLFSKLGDPQSLKSLVTNNEACRVAAANHSIPSILTETNSDASTAANMGQNSFANGFWYMSSLGEYALVGMPLHLRWKLWNPRVSYRPMALNQTFGFLDKTLTKAVPDLWIALMHKQLIGSGDVLAATTTADAVLLTWAHRSKNVDGSVVVMVVNTQTQPINVSIVLDNDSDSDSDRQRGRERREERHEPNLQGEEQDSFMRGERSERRLV